MLKVYVIPIMKEHVLQVKVSEVKASEVLRVGDRKGGGTIGRRSVFFMHGPCRRGRGYVGECFRVASSIGCTQEQVLHT